MSNNAGSTPPQLEEDIRQAVNRRWVLISALALPAAIVAAVVVLAAFGSATVESAVLNNEIWKVKVLASVGVDVNTPLEVNTPKIDLYRLTPLHLAARIGLVEMAATLIEVGADIEAEDSLTYRPLHIAARHDQSEVARALISAGAEVDSTTLFDGTPLHEAAYRGSVLTSKELIAAGADVHATTEEGYTPLHAAALNKQIGTGQLLVEAGADHKPIRPPAGWTPLHIAAANGDVSFARMLVDSGADVNAADARGFRPLHYAILRSSMGIRYFPSDRNEESGIKMVDVLINLGADVAAKSNQGSIPLHTAAGYEGNTDTINALIRAGADVNDRDDKSRTALFIAEVANHTSAAAMLVESGGKR